MNGRLPANDSRLLNFQGVIPSSLPMQLQFSDQLQNINGMIFENRTAVDLWIYFNKQENKTAPDIIVVGGTFVAVNLPGPQYVVVGISPQSATVAPFGHVYIYYSSESVQASIGILTPETPLPGQPEPRIWNGINIGGLSPNPATVDFSAIYKTIWLPRVPNNCKVILYQQDRTGVYSELVTFPKELAPGGINSSIEILSPLVRKSGPFPPQGYQLAIDWTGLLGGAESVEYYLSTDLVTTPHFTYLPFP